MRAAERTTPKVPQWVDFYSVTADIDQDKRAVSTLHRVTEAPEMQSFKIQMQHFTARFLRNNLIFARGTHI